MKTKFKLFTSTMLLFGCFYSQSQRLVINNNGYLTIDGGAHLVLSNSNTNAITLLGAGGNIVSESEQDIVDWKIGVNTGEYSIPFTTGSGVKIPLTVNLNTAGTGAGTIFFSTHTDTDGINSWNNSDYIPSGVSNLFGINGLVNNSAYVIDRFWSINAEGYSSKPSGQMNFGYNDVERSSVGNLISTGTLKAQYYNENTNTWVYPGTGIDNYPTTTVSGVPTTTNFFKTWTLSEETNPLPVELIYFTATEEENAHVNLNWSTVSELNNDYFSVQKSKGGVIWEEIGQVNGAGTSLQTEYYNLNDYVPHSGVSYYQLEQFDFNGESTLSNIEAVDFKGLELINLYPNPFLGGELTLSINALIETHISTVIYDNKGSLVYKQSQFLVEGNNSILVNLLGLAQGNYIIQVKTDNGLYKDQKELIIQ